MNAMPLITRNARNPHEIGLVIAPTRPRGILRPNAVILAVSNRAINDFLHCIKGELHHTEQIGATRNAPEQAYGETELATSQFWEIRMGVLTQFALCETDYSPHRAGLVRKIETRFLRSPIGISVLNLPEIET